MGASGAVTAHPYDLPIPAIRRGDRKTEIVPVRPIAEVGLIKCKEAVARPWQTVARAERRGKRYNITTYQCASRSGLPEKGTSLREQDD